MACDPETYNESSDSSHPRSPPGSNQSPADSHIRKEEKSVCPQRNRTWASLKQVGSQDNYFIIQQ